MKFKMTKLSYFDNVIQQTASNLQVKQIHEWQVQKCKFGANTKIFKYKMISEFQVKWTQVCQEWKTLLV